MEDDENEQGQDFQQTLNFVTSAYSITEPDWATVVWIYLTQRG